MNRLLTVAIIAACVLFSLAPVFAPYDQNEQHREEANRPPTRVEFRTAAGAPGWPFVTANGRQFPVRLFPRMRHVLGVPEPAHLFLFGTDEYGRDIFSRFLYGGRRSLLAGLLAALVAIVIGFTAGAAAGFKGGWLDSATMRCSELFLSLPLVYLLLAIRALMPLQVGEVGAIALVVAAAAVAGWPRPARLVRGVFLSAKERPYIAVARSLGATDAYLISRHILPQVRRLLWTQAATLLPQFMLVDVTLTFLGLGEGEPNATWGGMLTSLRHFSVLESHPGYWFEASLIGVVLFLFQFAADRHARNVVRTTIG